MGHGREVRRPWAPPTLREVAARAQISLATASRALSHPDDGAANRPAASEHVRAVARQLGYVGHEAPAPRLAAFTSDITRTGYWETLSGITVGARTAHVDVVIHVLAGSPEERHRTLTSALRDRIDGAVVLEFDSPAVEIITELPRDVPVAIAGGYPSETLDLPRAWIDDFTGAVDATEHLVGLGHRRIGFVGVPAAGHPDPRVRGWRHVIRGSGLGEVAPLGTGWSASTGRRAATRAIDAGVTGILCGNDDLALGVLAGLADAGRRVPEDVSVIGMDDHPLARCASPALTTVRLDFQAVGEAAATLALGLGAPGAEQVVRIPTELLVRGSTAPPPAS